MLSEKFLQLISKGLLGRWFAKRSAGVEDLDPERIYVENVRSILGVPFWVARMICEAGVREGTLVRRFAYYCPNDGNHRIVAVSDEPLAPDETVECEVCELKGDVSHSFRVADLKSEKIYGFRRE